MVNARAHIFVSGIVQGVFFRQKTKQQADSLGVNGWVRNLPDGRVEAVFEGGEEAVKKIVDYSRHGPANAYVTHIEASWEPYRGEFRGFKTF